MESIKIENPTEFVGSVSWLKDQIGKMRYRFAEKDGSPCVDYGILSTEKESGKKIVKWYTAVVMADSPEIRHNLFEVCDEYNETYITYPSANATHEHGWSMFPYLSPYAQTQCNRIIRMLADELIKKVKSDRGDLKIKVIVELCN